MIRSEGKTNLEEIVKKFLLVSMIMALLFTLSATGQGEGTTASYPEGAITMVVPYGAGGTTDVTGRKFAVALQKQLGVPVTIQNISGASGSVGAKAVLDAKPDGYTVHYTADSLGTQQVMGISDMSYDDFTPVMAVVNDPKVIVVKGDSKYETLEDLLADMKRNPGKVKMSYTGPGGSGHVQALIFEEQGYDMALTAYAGGGDCIIAVLGDQVDFTNSNFSTIKKYLASGDLKLLGISALDRLPGYPEVPTLAEADPAFTEYLSIPFTPLSLVVDKDVDPAVVKVLREASLKAVQDADWLKFVEENNLEELYRKYPEVSDISKFYDDWKSIVTYLLFDAGATKHNPADFGIKRAGE